MPDQADLLPGTLDLLILKAVSLGKLHGYAVLLRIEQISGGALQVQQGALYPALYRLEHQGLIEGEWGTSENNRRAKYYRLTAAGRRRLGDETASWNRLVEAIARSLAATPQEIR
jgi:transcriptional regulator